MPVGLTLEKPYFYEIRIEGQITDRWSDWFEGLTIRNVPDDDTILSGMICDQAALFGVLNKIHGLNLKLVSINRIEERTSTGM